MNKLESGFLREYILDVTSILFYDVTNIKFQYIYIYIYNIYYNYRFLFIILECKNQSHKIQLYLCMYYKASVLSPSLEKNSIRTRFELDSTSIRTRFEQTSHGTDALLLFTYTRRRMYLLYTGRPLH